MSKDIFTFYKYITTTNSYQSNTFKDIFNSKIELLPDKIVSSKYLIKYFDIKTELEFYIFQNVFLDYFRKMFLKV